MNHHVPAAIFCALLVALVLILAPVSSKADEWSQHADKWSATDKALMSSFVVLEVIDVAQTRKALRKGGYEMNPIFGKHPSDAALVGGKALATGAIYWLADSYPTYRTEMLIGVNIVQALVVRHNYVGAQVGWGF